MRDYTRIITGYIDPVVEILLSADAVLMLALHIFEGVVHIPSAVISDSLVIDQATIQNHGSQPKTSCAGPAAIQVHERCVHQRR